MGFGGRLARRPCPVVLAAAPQKLVSVAALPCLGKPLAARCAASSGLGLQLLDLLVLLLQLLLHLLQLLVLGLEHGLRNRSGGTRGGGGDGVVLAGALFLGRTSFLLLLQASLLLLLKGSQMSQRQERDRKHKDSHRRVVARAPSDGPALPP